MVGNGVANSRADFMTVDIEFLYGHGLISRKLYVDLVAACNQNPSSAACQQYRQTASSSMNNIDIYDIYTDCYHQRSIYDTVHRSIKIKPREVPPCTDALYATEYLTRQDVMQAIHVNPSLTWSICSGVVNEYYNRTRDSMVPIHQYLVKNGIRVFIYSGDADFAVPYTDSEYWTSTEMGLSATKDWRQWYFTDADGQQVAGFVTEYGSIFSFATIKGSGHMVPQFAPQTAFVMFQRVLMGQPL